MTAFLGFQSAHSQLLPPVEPSATIFSSKFVISCNLQSQTCYRSPSNFHARFGMGLRRAFLPAGLSSHHLVDEHQVQRPMCIPEAETPTN